ncbi:HAMP domain-containing histidine kinase [Hymenobacter sp. BT186]|uniref:histidine kinase n=1 Tax=Hymenobacter telluris TaxID=2816474 RepID=A0A939F188_9BACT|nr:HAMP domain-containing sensor histidine kinase [Hymenobacter telluris]MBO0360994.1 HAMP domain-containing histidine kinase [Hymenobacter telluris]MBW3377022.1 HAMP domain-containing histidine kinase [Hymenobacter norwichensis]
MKLNYRYTIAYAVISFCVLLIGFAIVYAALSRSVTQATIGKLKHLNEVVAAQLRSGRNYSQHPARAHVLVRRAAPTDTARHAQLVQVRDEWDASLQSTVSVVRLTTYPVVRGQRFWITSKAVVVEPSDVYLTGLMLVFAWTFVFLLALVVILSEVISWRILKPFNAILRGIQRFQLGQPTTLELQPSRTAEFNVLSDFLVTMTTRAQSDYQGLKEFSENASHELQTPIASIKAKIELLMDSELSEKQLLMLTAMHDELERLTKINQSLTLLAKLENFESQPATLTDMSDLVQATEAAFADLAEMKGLRTTLQLVPEVRVPLDVALAQLLLNNLFSNAIRHNVPGGEIHALLSPTEFTLRNTGHAPSVPVGELFGRFKKGNAALDSIGIGLAIVKRIGELYGHQVDYSYAEGWHTIRVVFAAPAV